MSDDALDERIAYLEAALVAIRNPVPIIEIVMAADTHDEALSRIADYLGCSKASAIGVLEIQFKRVLPSEVPRMEADLAARRLDATRG